MFTQSASTSQFIATIGTSTAQVPTPTTFTEWGLVGAVIWLSVQKIWESFSKRQSSDLEIRARQEAAESALILKLIEGLRENQTQMLGQMMRVTELSHGDIRDLKEAIVGLTTATRSEIQIQFQQQNCAVQELRHDLAELRDKLEKL